MASRLVLPLASLMLSIVSVLLLDSLLAILQKGPDTVSVNLSWIFMNAYITFLVPINFYLNLLLLLLNVMTHDHVPALARGPILLFMMKYLPSAAQIVSFSTLVFGAPVFVCAAVYEDSVSFAIGAAMVCLSLVTIISSSLKKVLNSGGFMMPILFPLCIFTSFLLSLDPLSPLSNKYDPIPHQIPLHFLLISASFVRIVLCITLLTLRIGVLAATHIENLVIVALRFAIATLLVGGYMKAFVEFTTGQVYNNI